MTISLANGASTIELDADLYWSDEFNWTAVEQGQDRSITGALIVQAAARTGGRPITLQPEDETSAWMTRQVLEQLQTWASSPGLVMQLQIRGTTRDVAFRHQDVAIEARPIKHMADTDPGDFYLATIRLMEIQ